MSLWPGRIVLMALGISLGLAAGARGWAVERPTGAPLVLSATETEQPVPLVSLSPDGRSATCTTVRLHWKPIESAGEAPAVSIESDLALDRPGGLIFTTQLWKASLAAAQAWQQAWDGATWKILDVPPTDGTGIDAALAVGMVATSARRPYPLETVVIATLNPDGSLGPVTRLRERMEAAAAANIKKVVVASGQAVEPATGSEFMRLAATLHLQGVRVDTLVAAVEAVMDDPLPAPAPPADARPETPELVTFLSARALREENEAKSGLVFAPKVEALGGYSAAVAATWRAILSDCRGAEKARQQRRFYAAYRLYQTANARMHGLNELAGATRTSFDPKGALAAGAALLQQLHAMVSPPALDRGDLQSALLVAEFGDWSDDLQARLQGATLVVKQAYSPRTEATEAQKEQARESLLSALEEVRYALQDSAFFDGIAARVAARPIPVEANATALLPQLWPAQLARAEILADQLRPSASESRGALLFDRELAGYLPVLRDTQNAWEAYRHRRELEGANLARKAAGDAPSVAPRLDRDIPSTRVAFDPGSSYNPPRLRLEGDDPGKKTSEVAHCLTWVNDDATAALLVLRYSGLIGGRQGSERPGPAGDRLERLLQIAAETAQQGLTRAAQLAVDPTVLELIQERALTLREQGDEESAREALKQYWRGAALGNLCAQLAPLHKAKPVDLQAVDPIKEAARAALPVPAPGSAAAALPLPRAETAPSQIPEIIVEKLPAPSPDTKPSPPPPRAALVELEPAGETAPAPRTPTKPVVGPPAPPAAIEAVTPPPIPEPKPERVAPVDVPTPSETAIDEAAIPVAKVAKPEDFLQPAAAVPPAALTPATQAPAPPAPAPVAPASTVPVGEHPR